MKLAFVIPAYNEEALIGQCLESVLREKAKSASAAEIEIIVVNNASTDRTKEIASSYPGVRVVDEMQKGLVQARHAGLMATEAELVANIDADTMLTPGWIETVLKEFGGDARMVSLSGPFIYYDLPRARKAMVRAFYLGTYAAYVLNHRILRIGSVVQGGNFVFKREAWLAVGGYDRSITFYGEDTDVAKRLSKVGHAKWTFRLPIYASGRRLKEEGIMTTGWTYAKNYFSVTFAGKPATTDYKDIRPDQDGK